ncbi:zinc-ribbon domain-containing protein [Moritella sp. 24]|nr:zinc-ribbon domain-containing protein [Moritella sp. 24]
MSNVNTDNKNSCNQCDTALVWRADLYHCDDCKLVYKKISFCPDCNAV